MTLPIRVHILTCISAHTCAPTQNTITHTLTTLFHAKKYIWIHTYIYIAKDDVKMAKLQRATQ